MSGDVFFFKTVLFSKFRKVLFFCGEGVNGGGFGFGGVPSQNENYHEKIQIFSTYHSSPRSIVNIVTCHAIIN